MNYHRKIIAKFQTHAFLGLLLNLVCFWQLADSACWPDKSPGEARVALKPHEFTLSNAVIEARWSVRDGRLRLLSVSDKLSGSTIDMDATAFAIELDRSALVRSEDVAMTGEPAALDLKPDPEASVFSDRCGGKAVRVDMEHKGSGLQIEWKGILRDGSNYIRQEITLRCSGQENLLKSISILELTVPGAEVRGRVDGSPVVAENMFFAAEHPLAKNRCNGGRIFCGREPNVRLKPEKPFVISSVIGVVPEGQLRRGFLYYLERERAHCYRHYLHYNSWFDLNVARPDNRMTEQEVLEAIKAIGTELVTRRHVPMDGFVMDDGWDSHSKIWEFHEGFPNGFKDIGKAAGQFGAGIGVWMSPWGGYDKPKKQRLQSGSKAGFETNRKGFSMAGSNYGRHFRDTCLRMMREFEVNYFKFDGMGGGVKARGADKELAEDVEAILEMTKELRSFKPDLFINATVGTWPSPFWTRYADSIWRQGDDINFAGVGSKREQWITYRDKLTQERIVKMGPLYPLNSLMFHGLVIGPREIPGQLELDETSVRSEIRTAFGCGSGLQELYITARLLTPQMWDDLAEAAKWSQANLDVLVDTHWIGGSPGKLEVYGWGAWNPRKSVLVLRNPNSKGQEFSFGVEKAFELPPGSAKHYEFKSPYKDQRIQSFKTRIGESRPLKLEPFEVLVFDGQPDPTVEPRN